MLHKHLRDYFLHNVDDDSTGTTTDTQPDKTGQGSADEKKFTQADLDKVAASSKKAAREKALIDYFTDVGLSDAQIRELIKNSKAQEEANKTEVQKLADDLARSKAELEAERKAKADLEKARRDDKRDAELNLLLLDARSAKQVMTLLKAENAEALEALIADDGSFDKGAAEKLLEAFRKENSHLFRDTQNPGSQSNNDGKPPQPNKEAQELAKKEIEQKFRL